MTEVLATPGRDIDFDVFADITAAAVLSIDWADGGRLAVTFGADLSAAEISAVRRRMMSVNAQEEQLRERAEVFIAADPASVTYTQLVQVVQRLARLVLRDL